MNREDQNPENQWLCGFFPLILPRIGQTWAIFWAGRKLWQWTPVIPLLLRGLPNAIRSENLPLPELTVITHWHWDHTFGMYAVHGEILARPETSDKLAHIQAEMEADPDKASRFLNSDASIRREYAGGVPLKVVPAGKIVTEDQSIDLGGLTVELLWSVSPHTDDSLLVYVPDDHVLFVGDAQLGEFPSWRMDFDKARCFGR